ncbi:hypothetical protein CYMTET_26740 [Cymbomonas tetramitiformis]|uniref:EF-hand domain-containing protein n=1 Tax=Cymbomonas tetramitiformis TaxID=36881 RepID=A0AAE0KXU7_9CHLO|nr:hypothetical protein CYMTET_26740 [Cymbomonas tetramitiformis]
MVRLRAQLPRMSELVRVKAHDAVVYCCAWAPAGNWVASAGADGAAKVWDVGFADETGDDIVMVEEPIQELRRPVSKGGVVDNWVLWCVFTRDGAHLLTAHMDHTLVMWSCTTWTEALPALCGHAQGVLACDSTGDGKQMVSCSGDGTLRVWDLKAAIKLGANPAHTGRVRGCEIGGGGGIITAGEDGVFRIWKKPMKAREGPPPSLAVEVEADVVLGCDWSEDSMWIAVATGSRGLLIYSTLQQKGHKGSDHSEENAEAEGEEEVDREGMEGVDEILPAEDVSPPDEKAPLLASSAPRKRGWLDRLLCRKDTVMDSHRSEAIGEARRSSREETSGGGPGSQAGREPAAQPHAPVRFSGGGRMTLKEQHFARFGAQSWGPSGQLASSSERQARAPGQDREVGPRLRGGGGGSRGASRPVMESAQAVGSLAATPSPFRPIVSLSPSEDSPGATITTCKFSKDSDFLLTGGHSNAGAEVRLWRCGAWECVARLEGHRAAPVTSVDFAPDGDWACSCDGPEGSGLRLWDISGVLDPSVEEPAHWEIPQDTRKGGASVGLGACAWSPCGKRVAAAMDTGEVRVWYVGTGSTESVAEGTTFDECDADGDGVVTKAEFQGAAAKSVKGEVFLSIPKAHRGLAATACAYRCALRMSITLREAGESCTCVAPLRA